jgi:hypothetical protein
MKDEADLQKTQSQLSLRGRREGGPGNVTLVYVLVNAEQIYVSFNLCCQDKVLPASTIIVK